MSMDHFCPYCGRIVPACQRCTCRPRPKRKPTKGDATRKEREPWRSEYSTAAYQRARQEAIARTGGRCTDCGRVCARFDGKVWRTAGLGGEVDHVRALCDGGTNDAWNLQLRCKSCHKRRDDARRRAEGRQ
jgi:5-methylcytosine-specific restriction endonuclease McrA